MYAGRMIHLYNKDSGERIGEISQEQRQTLIDLFEEEDSKDQDYFVNAGGVDHAGTMEVLQDSFRDSS